MRRAHACRVHNRVNAVNVVPPYSALCSHECEHGTHECVRYVGICKLTNYPQLPPQLHHAAVVRMAAAGSL